jgi:hypothetical protein
MQPEELKALTKESYEEGYKELVRLLNLEFKKAATSGKFMITITIPPLFKKDIIPQLEEVGYKVEESPCFSLNKIRMSIISTLKQEEPILVTAKELRRIVAIENDRDYYEFLKDANNIL